jgi:hypothetical protein
MRQVFRWRTLECCDAVAAVAEPVRLAYLWQPTLPDVDDDMVLEAAGYM